MSLPNVEPADVFRYFRSICRIPHGSGNERELTEYILRFARERGLWAVRDGSLNVIVKKPASSGRANSPALLLQCHMDMVCEKNSGKVFDFTKDPVEIVMDGDTIKSNGTTLGADNGLGVAMMLAVLGAKDIPHPPLEAVFTAEEEIGLVGATAMDMSALKARRMINLDTGGEGTFVVSCAGGLRVGVHLPVRQTDADASGSGYEIWVKGLKGGHSGGDIDKERGNANVILGRALYRLAAEPDFRLRLASLEGGEKENAIPREACAHIVTDGDPSRIVAELKRTFTKEYHATEPHLDLFIGKKELPPKVYDEASRDRIIQSLLTLPHGVVHRMNSEGGWSVETSNNLATVSARDENVRIVCAIRSNVASRKYALLDRIRIVTGLLGGTIEPGAEYPAWEYAADSPLRTAAAKVYEELRGAAPEIKVTHGGLECGLFAERIPGLDIISFGPSIYDAHTPDEWFSISSLSRTWEFFKALLASL